MIISNRIADIAPISVYFTFGLISFNPSPKPIKMLAIIPIHPIICGTTLEIINNIEKDEFANDRKRKENKGTNF